MFVNKKQIRTYGCEIFGWGHTTRSDNPKKFKIVTQYNFLKNYIPNESKVKIFGHPAPFSKKEITEKVQQAIEKIGFETRTFFDGKNYEMAIIAANKCLKTTGLLPSQIDAFILGTNTGEGYPSGADHVKNGLTLLYNEKSRSNAMCYDMTEACTVGSIAVFNGWNLIKSGACKNVMVILSEKGTELADPKEWTESNLFGDAAAALLLTRSDKESFIFFDIDSLPNDGNLTAIYKNENGYFKQDTRKVHRFVGDTVSNALTTSIQRAEIDPSKINHIIAHQPSKKTLDFLERHIKEKIPTFKGKFHWDIKDTGNTSSVSTPALISKLISTGKIKRGDFIFVTTFGAGTSFGNYGFTY